MTPAGATWGTRLGLRLLFFKGRVRPSRWSDPRWIERLPIVCESTGMVWNGLGLRLEPFRDSKEPVRYLAVGWRRAQGSRKLVGRPSLSLPREGPTGEGEPRTSSLP